MSNKEHYFKDLLNKHCSILEENDILEMNERWSSCELNNVVVGIDRECFGLMLMDDGLDTNYKLFYMNGTAGLKGAILELSIELEYRENLVLSFAAYLSQEFTELDLVDTFNTFQKHTRSMLEKLDFMTLTSEERDEIKKKNGMILVNNVRGVEVVNFLDKAEFYRSFFEADLSVVKTGDEKWIYIMLNKHNGYYKIGNSKSPIFREKTLQSSEPEVVLIACWKAPSSVERELHSQFVKKRQRGEWFDLTFSDLKKIKEKMSRYENGNEE